jgi:hypothetical protein
MTEPGLTLASIGISALAIIWLVFGIAGMRKSESARDRLSPAAVAVGSILLLWFVHTAAV